MVKRDVLIEKCAESAHDCNRVYRAAIGEDPGPRWEDTPVGVKQSTIAGVELVLFSVTCPSVNDLHDAWLARKLKAGWRYGETKDVDKKVHPCLLPRSALPLVEQKKDLLFYRIVDSMCFILTGLEAPVIETDDGQGWREMIAADVAADAKGEAT